MVFYLINYRCYLLSRLMYSSSKSSHCYVLVDEDQSLVAHYFVKMANSYVHDCQLFLSVSQLQSLFFTLFLSDLNPHQKEVVWHFVGVKAFDVTTYDCEVIWTHHGDDYCACFQSLGITKFIIHNCFCAYVYDWVIGYLGIQNFCLYFA